MSSGVWARPNTMKAVVLRGAKALVERDRPLPRLRDDYVLVKTEAVALNPTDWKHVNGGLGAEGGLVGCDFSGVVKEIGRAVTKSWKVGDHICGVAHGSNKYQPEDGAFAEYIVAKGDIQMRIPEHMTFAQAATIGLGATTVGQGLYQQALHLPLPPQAPRQRHDNKNVLIYGGSTATGALGIQYARLSGFSVYTTCSPKNFDYVKSLGAIEAFDYNDEISISRLRDQTKDNELRLAWDTIGTPASAEFCMKSLSTRSDCKYGCISYPPVPISRADVKNVGTLMYSVFGEPFEKRGNNFPASPEDFAFTKRFMAITEELLAQGQLRPHAALVGKDGLEGVLKGMKDMKDGKVSGQKLVYLVADTP
ncbi:uncharacterized protein PV06_08647 [Exophiala oligosperma]|uniref:Enoyl reductase (ER) domain-containing protein n=1 Tax=Exophiala oligosperma TaxID=215243 RepID=A0A0D2D6I2_9EURO|nr:uncharacterized protein PV06_08647 [Exophiala oligosperma]KIW38808.1 hypothetical protein PV06_08647 [Exophiala oligosperma]